MFGIKIRVQAGYSLIELMISSVVAIIVLGGAFQVVIDSKQRDRENAAVGAIQDSARYAMHVLSQDLFMAGYWGCATVDTANVSNVVRTNAGGFIEFSAITGYEGESSIIDFPVDLQARAIKGNDAFIVRHADSYEAHTVREHKSPSATIKIWDKHDYAIGDTLVITEANCRQMAIFQMSGPSNGASEVIGHNTNKGDGNAADNCANGLKGNFTCPSSCAGKDACSDAIEADYLPGSKIMRFVANAYYIGRSNVYAGTDLEETPILFRQELSPSGAIKTKAVEIAQGIETLDVIYGVDLTGDGEVNQFLKASSMDLDGSGFVTQDEWQSVVAVRFNLVFRSLDPVFNANQPVTLNEVKYNDRYLRQEFSQTVQLRNHG